jgi:hypothetical protein
MLEISKRHLKLDYRQSDRKAGARNARGISLCGSENLDR